MSGNSLVCSMMLVLAVTLVWAERRKKIFAKWWRGINQILNDTSLTHQADRLADLLIKVLQGIVLVGSIILVIGGLKIVAVTGGWISA